MQHAFLENKARHVLYAKHSNMQNTESLAAAACSYRATENSSCRRCYTRSDQQALLAVRKQSVMRCEILAHCIKLHACATNTKVVSSLRSSIGSRQALALQQVNFDMSTCGESRRACGILYYAFQRIVGRRYISKAKVFGALYVAEEAPTLVQELFTSADLQ